MRRKHIFKNRRQRNFTLTNSINFGSISLYSPIKQCFEFVFFRVVRKLFRRRFCKAQMRFVKPKFWLFIRTNFIFSAKSKNARMGAGVGGLVRLSLILAPQKALIEFKYFSYYFLQKARNYLQFKCSLKLNLNFLRYYTN